MEPKRNTFFRILAALAACVLMLAAFCSPARADAYEITLTTDGNGTATVETSNPEDEGMMVFVTASPSEGYVFESCTPSVDLSENEYSEAYSGWPDVGIMFRMPGEPVALDIAFSEAITATYDANGGTTGEMWQDTRIIKKGQTEEIYDPDESEVAAPEGMVFAGVEIGGTTLEPGDSYTFNSDVTVTYLWAEDTENPGDPDKYCTVTMDINGGTPGGNWLDEVEFERGRDTHIWADPAEEDIAYPPEGFMFDGWEMDGVAYAPGIDVTIPDAETATVKLLWREDDSSSRCTATYDFNGGTKHEDAIGERDLERGSEEDVAVSGSFADPPEGMVFDGIEVDGVVYGPDDTWTVPDTEAVTVKLLWREQGEIRAFTLDINGGTPGEDWVDELEFEVGTTVTVPDSADNMAIAPEGCKFGGFEFDGVVYAPGDEFTVPDGEGGTMKFVWVAIEPEPEPEPEPAPAPAPAPQPSVPKTGDVAGMAGLLAAFGALALAFSRKRR